jgi:L-rhamnose mutarotase
LVRAAYALDLRDAPTAIAEYEAWHRVGGIWSSVMESPRASRIADMEIHRTGNRLFMVVEMPDRLPHQVQLIPGTASNDYTRAWEEHMWTFQRALPWAKPGQKWVVMRRILPRSF